MPDELGIAVVGFGLIGRRHADALRQAHGVRLAAVVEPDPQGRDAARASGAAGYASLAEMFADIRLDGVVLATPTLLHVEQGLECIAAGCPILVEKPIAATAAEAYRLTEAAAAGNVPVLVGHHRRHNGRLRAAKQAIDEGAIGAIRSVQSTCWFYKPDYYFDEARWRTKKGAGPISVNLIHDVDMLRWLCGEVASVQAVASPARRGFENEDLATALLTFASGAIGSLTVSDSIAAPWNWELTSRENPAYPATSESCLLIGGSEGSLSLPDLRVWRHDDAPDWWTPISARFLTCGSDDPLVVQMAHFGAVIRGEAEPLVSGIEGTRSLEVVEAIARAAAGGGTVHPGKAPSPPAG